MKIAVVSDSHDNLSKIEEFAKIVNSEDIDLVIHCGDFVSPFSVKLLLSKLKCDFIGVFGNNDGEVAGLLKISGGLLEKTPIYKEIDGKRFAIMHEPFFVDSLSKSADFDYILYGHTHKLDTRVINGCQIINPGELCGYLTGKSTFVILDTFQRFVEVRVL
ncbi:metallophosphoesterase [Desulfurobacterium thermolithotrophum]|uniref:metallophosphoesterase n=1 Tax=Desulfurobacterium thermolithotrophum TaxID=64160 RepID=UPI0013D2F523|nr:metallophosphoesterase [Desulfurobacterium thermolithotrophum]